MSKRILLVEDDQFLQQLYYELLTSESYDVTGIVDGEKAYEEIKKNNWDLILLDIMLPHMDGFQILDKIKEEKIKLSCPVIYLTNLDGSNDDNAQLKKAQDHWVKSNMSPPEFVAKVKALLKK